MQYAQWMSWPKNISFCFCSIWKEPSGISRWFFLVWATVVKRYGVCADFLKVFCLPFQCRVLHIQNRDQDWCFVMYIIRLFPVPLEIHRKTVHFHVQRRHHNCRIIMSMEKALMQKKEQPAFLWWAGRYRFPDGTRLMPPCRLYAPILLASDSALFFFYEAVSRTSKSQRRSYCNLPLNNFCFFFVPWLLIMTPFLEWSVTDFPKFFDQLFFRDFSRQSLCLNCCFYIQISEIALLHCRNPESVKYDDQLFVQDFRQDVCKTR